MNDKQLADAVVLHCGVVMERSPHSNLYGLEVPEFEADHFVRDWRVAGAMIKRCNESEAAWDLLAGLLVNVVDWDGGFVLNNTLTDCRATIEACVQAMAQ